MERNLSEKHANSLAKKRARDRRAQQNQRNRRNEQVRLLQDQVARMEREEQLLKQECELLRQENQELRARDGSGSDSVTSWSTFPAEEDVETAQGHGADARNRCASAEGPVLPRSKLNFWSQCSGVTSSSQIICSIELPSPCRDEGLWAKTPTHSAFDLVVTDSFKSWLQRPDLVLSSPEHPQPLELLYGSKTNLLADVIHHILRSWPCRDPERLAAGWLMYYQIKWMLRPSPENYGRLQGFQLPVAEQLEHSHAYFIDFILWPRLRANMILHGTMYSPQDVVGMLMCCVKLRWPWGQNFLEPVADGTWKMRRDFFETFTSLDGWGLTEDFLREFPALGEGLDLSAMRYQFG